MFFKTSSPPASEANGVHFLNTRIVFHRSGVGAAAPLAVMEHWMPHGEAPPLHCHEGEDEIFHILEGRFRFRVGDREILAGPGDSLVAPKGVPHTFRVESAEGGRCYVMTPGVQFEGLIRALARPAPSAALPAPVRPTPEMQDALIAAGQQHGIAILGPPMEA